MYLTGSPIQGFRRWDTSHTPDDPNLSVSSAGYPASARSGLPLPLTPTLVDSPVWPSQNLQNQQITPDSRLYASPADATARRKDLQSSTYMHMLDPTGRAIPLPQFTPKYKRDHTQTRQPDHYSPNTIQADTVAGGGRASQSGPVDARDRSLHMSAVPVPQNYADAQHDEHKHQMHRPPKQKPEPLPPLPACLLTLRQFVTGTLAGTLHAKNGAALFMQLPRDEAMEIYQQFQAHEDWSIRVPTVSDLDDQYIHQDSVLRTWVAAFKFRDTSSPLPADWAWQLFIAQKFVPSHVAAYLAYTLGDIYAYKNEKLNRLNLWQLMGDVLLSAHISVLIAYNINTVTGLAHRWPNQYSLQISGNAVQISMQFLMNYGTSSSSFR